MVDFKDIFSTGIRTFRIDLNKKEISMNALMESFRL